jgi:dephospho-CoA kinase
MIRAGITGGLGSGKSIVCKVFSSLGIPVYNADMAARRLMNKDEEIIAKLTKQFGKDIYTEQGLNRKIMSQKIFRDKNLLEIVNSIVHPVVKEDFEKWCLKNNHQPYVVKEAAILIEGGGYKNLDKIILVTAPIELRIERVKKRDGRSLKEIKKILANQLPDEKKRPFADFIIENNDKRLILPAILEIHNHLLKIST